MAYTTIDNPELYFQTKVYTSDGGDDTAITYDGSEDMAPNLVWIKDQSSATSSYVCDSVRGSTKRLRSDGTNAEATETTAVKSFGSDGYTLGTHGAVNSNTSVYATWNWKAGTTSGLSGGTITPSAYSINTTSGFGMYGYAGNSTAGATITHGLGTKPGWITCKRLNDTGGWTTFHSGAGATKFAYLDLTDIFDSGSTEWNDTEPTTSVFSLGTHGTVNNSAGTYIAYVWADVQGFSKFGSYEGNGNVDGPFVYTGFRPAYFMTKRTDSANSWVIFDNKRDPHNEVVNHLSADSADANEAGTSDSDVDFCSNGIKIKEDNNGVNASGGTYVYMAFAEAPFVNSKGVPANAR